MKQAKSICPKCGKKYTGLPSLSRRDVLIPSDLRAIPAWGGWGGCGGVRWGGFFDRVCPHYIQILIQALVSCM